jgi:hypothetical protein
MVLELYIRLDIEHRSNKNHAVPCILQLFCAVRYACGSYQHVVGDGIGIHRASVSRIITRVTNAISRLSNRLICFPTIGEELALHKDRRIL